MVLGACSFTHSQCVTPLAHRGLHVSAFPSRVVLEAAPLFRAGGSRRCAEHRYLCDRTTALSGLNPLQVDDNSKRALGFISAPGLIAQGPFFFSCLVCGANRSPSDLSETPKQFLNSVVREQSRTRSLNACSTSPNGCSVKR